MARLLIIDDDEAVRDALSVLATVAGHDTRMARDGRDGMAHVSSFDPDLVITDILMPVKEGIETIRELRRLRPTVPIIAMSGGGRLASRDVLEIAQKFGANHLLTKPFAGPALMAAIADLLSRECRRAAT